MKTVLTRAPPSDDRAGPTPVTAEHERRIAADRGDGQRPASRAATAASEQTGQFGSRRSLQLGERGRRGHRTGAAGRRACSPIPSRTLSASLAWSMPMIPGTTPRTPATEQPGASSGGGGVGYRQR